MPVHSQAANSREKRSGACLSRVVRHIVNFRRTVAVEFGIQLFGKLSERGFLESQNLSP
jgi:hypothetical protein